MFCVPVHAQRVAFVRVYSLTCQQKNRSSFFIWGANRNILLQLCMYVLTYICIYVSNMEKWGQERHKLWERKSSSLEGLLDVLK